MALDATLEWNFTNGSSASINNGGGFKRGASGTDYSYGGSLPANDAPHLAFTDLEVKGGVYTRLYSTTHAASLVAGLIGNIIHVTGDGGSGNFTAGWYEVTANGNDGSNYVDIDRACATGNANDGVANLGGALGVPSDAFYESPNKTAGNIIFYKDGTYTLTASVSTQMDGTSDQFILHVGYASTKWDRPEGNDRPLIAAGAYAFEFDNYWGFRNLRGTGTNTRVWSCDNYPLYNNCFVINSSGSANRVGFFGTTSTKIVDCQAKSTLGIAIACDYYNQHLVSKCFVYDSAIGIRIGLDSHGNNSLVVGCIIDSCTTGILLDTTARQVTLEHNTFYHNTLGLDGGAAKFCTILNNIFKHDTGQTGAAWDASEDSNYWQNNNWYGDGTDVSNITKGSNATAFNPDFENAGSDDFRLKTTSSCIAAGLGMAIGTGGNATDVDQGALQTTVAGGLLTHPGMSGGMRG